VFIAKGQFLGRANIAFSKRIVSESENRA